ncbi:MAG: outer membrane protein [Pirellulaceae bacterium]
MRGYSVVRLGQGVFTEDDSAGGLEPDRGTGILGAGGFGLNLTRHWGAEYVMEDFRAQLQVSGIGDVSGCPIATGFLRARGRYPLADGRAVPYVVFGLGFSFGQEGNLDKPRSLSGFSAENDWSFAVSAGAGVDYSMDQNIALGIEVRHTALFDVDVNYAGCRQSLSMDYVSISGRVRIFFP